MANTSTMRTVAVYIPLVSGWLSILGSSSIIYSIYAQRATKLKDPQHRIMLGMSIFDVCYSLCKALTFALYPSGLGVATFGNMRTCAFQGFFTQFGYAVGMYNLVLSLYYYLTIVKSMKRREFSKCLEKCCHSFIIVLTLAFASTGVGIGLFNPTPAFCYIAPQGPPGCASKGTCTKFGDTFPIFYEVFAQLWIQIAYVGVIGMNIAIWWFVRGQERTMLKYTQSCPQYQEQKRKTKHAHKVFVQSILYVGAFLLSWSWATIFHLIGWISGYQALWPVLLINIFLPMQGFFNAFIYARPRYMRIKSKGIKFSFCETLQIVFLPEHSRAGKSVISTASLNQTSVADNQNASAEMAAAEEGKIEPMNRMSDGESVEAEPSDALQETERETIDSSHHP